jgi:hypothetical protein
MPASSQLVSLDHAKDWAKRLVKHGCLPTLAKAQAAVALMLGHADWHGLTQHYQKSSVPLSDLEETAAIAQAPLRPMDEAMDVLCADVNRLYPGLNATRVVEMARDVDLFDTLPHLFADEVKAHDWNGYGVTDAVKEALAAHVHAIKAPPGHILLRVEVAEPGPLALVLVPSNTFGRALHEPVKA